MALSLMVVHASYLLKFLNGNLMNFHFFSFFSKQPGFYLIFFFGTGECCVALYSLTGASEKFETFLSHRGEEMGSIRGRIRVHVPKDRRATRQKIYGRLT